MVHCGITCAIFIGLYMIYLALHICASLTFKGKIRLIDKFIGYFDEEYKYMCNEFIEANAEMEQRR